ncbi:L-asparagine permease [Salmonella bongori]|nr:L-asparagine permease [Salmonella bongori]
MPREFLGEKAAYVAGWMYFINWAMTGIVDITAVALYMHYWGAFGDVPQWVFALGALAIVGTMNMIGVKWFAEMEFWFALVKVLAIVIFLVVGTIFLGTGQPLDGNTTGFHLITDNGGFFSAWPVARAGTDSGRGVRLCFQLSWLVLPPASAKIRRQWCQKPSIA